MLKEIFIECSFLLQHFPKCDASSNTRQCAKNLICLPCTKAAKKMIFFLQKRVHSFRQLLFFKTCLLSVLIVPYTKSLRPYFDTASSSSSILRTNFHIFFMPTTTARKERTKVGWTTFFTFQLFCNQADNCSVGCIIKHEFEHKRRYKRAY